MVKVRTWIPVLLICVASLGCRQKPASAGDSETPASAESTTAAELSAQPPSTAPAAVAPRARASMKHHEIVSDDCVFSLDAPEHTRFTDDVLPPHTEGLTVLDQEQRVMTFIAHSRSGVESLADMKVRYDGLAMRGGSDPSKPETVRTGGFAHAATENGVNLVIRVSSSEDAGDPMFVYCNGNDPVQVTNERSKTGCHFVAFGMKSHADEMTAMCKSVRIRRGALASDHAAKAAARKARAGDSRALLP